MTFQTCFLTGCRGKLQRHLTTFCLHVLFGMMVLLQTQHQRSEFPITFLGNSHSYVLIYILWSNLSTSCSVQVRCIFYPPNGMNMIVSIVSRRFRALLSDLIYYTSWYDSPDLSPQSTVNPVRKLSISCQMVSFSLNGLAVLMESYIGNEY